VIDEEVAKEIIMEGRLGSLGSFLPTRTRGTTSTGLVSSHSPVNYFLVLAFEDTMSSVGTGDSCVLLTRLVDRINGFVNMLYFSMATL